jgi:hypothetical protein
MNDALCSPFNADFDGDQMNGYNVTGERERIETKEIMKLQHMFTEARVSVGGNYNILGQIQDAVIGIGLLTMPGVVLSRFDTIQLFRDININYDFDHGVVVGKCVNCGENLTNGHIYTGHKVFYEYLNQASKNIEQWPQWKKDLAGV